jgi:SEC-C motif
VIAGADTVCPCQSGRDYATCCGPFAQAKAISGEVTASAALASLRRHLLELVEHVPDLEEVWFAFADELAPRLLGPLLSRAEWELEQGRMDLFLWDFFQKISLARPILRIARDLETRDLRLASRLDDWSLRPWEAFEVVRHQESQDAWDLLNLATGKEFHVHVTFAHHEFKVGDGLVTRVLKHGGHSFTGLSMLRFPGAAGRTYLSKGWKELHAQKGLPIATQLRPDIHNEMWFAFHSAVLELWADMAIAGKPLTKAARKKTSASVPVSTAPDLDKPLVELGNQSAHEAAKHAMGQHRLKLWLTDLEARGVDVKALRKTLGLA